MPLSHLPGAADRGAVTVEAALALGTLALVTALAIGAIAAVGAAIRCTDAARELVRLTARGEPERGRAVAAALAPTGARIILTIRGDEASAEVTAAPVRLLPVRVSGRAVAVLEPDAAVSGPAPPAAPAAPVQPGPGGAAGPARPGLSDASAPAADPADPADPGGGPNRARPP